MDWVVNLSKHKLTEPERSVLEKGLNFAEAPKSIPRAQLIAGVESALQKITDQNKAERTRAIVAGLIRKAKPPKQNLTKEEHEAIRSIRNNKEIIVLQADKGNATVILDASDYERKAKDLLNNLPFKQVKKNPTARNERRVNDCLKRLLEKKAINKGTFDQLRVPLNGTRPSMFYGSIKLHRDGYPLRPIVSATGSATYRMAKFVSNLLTPYLRQTPSYLENANHFIEGLQHVRLEEDEIMVSFDVKSLFTSVPVPAAMQAVKEVLLEDSSFEERNKIAPDTVLEMLNVCLNSTDFNFKEHHYKLQDGLAMGSPVSPVVANLYMAKFERQALETFRDTQPKVWLRFVDDVFSIMKKRTVQNLLSHLNKQDPSIRFTIEAEENDHLPFMDVDVRRGKERLTTTVYRKPTHTGRYLSFTSNHPDSAKRSVVHALSRRTCYITEDSEAKISEQQRIKAELSLNGYPSAFIRKVTQPTTRREDCRSKDPDNSTATASIPYVPGLSESIRRALSQVQVQTVFRANPIKWQIMQGAKDTLATNKEPGAVYALGCQDCKKVYVGETMRTAEQRAKEHQMYTRTGNVNMSAVAAHTHQEGHTMHWKPRVVVKESNTVKRKIREALVIAQVERQGGSMNQDRGTSLSKIWTDLIVNLKE